MQVKIQYKSTGLVYGKIFIIGYNFRFCQAFEDNKGKELQTESYDINTRIWEAAPVSYLEAIGYDVWNVSTNVAIDEKIYVMSSAKSLSYNTRNGCCENFHIYDD
ncbi:unnamed protein product [Arabis nemorensis]|uniref:Uncharacterized protein n=1 Tax=Arabis nemorensis TaxID=586526 RepID=A0A565AZC6_9BRAS|nr:unnamed protein product [Arabis nemorensis]